MLCILNTFLLLESHVSEPSRPHVISNRRVDALRTTIFFSRCRRYTNFLKKVLLESYRSREMYWTSLINLENSEALPTSSRQRKRIESRCTIKGLVLRRVYSLDPSSDAVHTQVGYVKF